MLPSFKLHKLLNPWLLFCIGLVNLVPFVLVHSLLARAIQVLVFYLLAAGEKRIRLQYYIILVSSVLLFYLFVPNGRVLFRIGSLPITELAIQNGLFRGLSLCGYVFLSLWSISPSLRFPNRLGKLLSTSLRIYSSMFDSIGGQLHKKRGNKTEQKKSTREEVEVTRDSIAFVQRIDSTIANQLRLYLVQEKSKKQVQELSAVKGLGVLGILLIVSCFTWTVLLI